MQNLSNQPNLNAAKYDSYTVFPEDFDPVSAKMMQLEE
jgi:hypothetical protein